MPRVWNLSSSCGMAKAGSYARVVRPFSAWILEARERQTAGVASPSAGSALSRRPGATNSRRRPMVPPFGSAHRWEAPSRNPPAAFSIVRGAHGSTEGRKYGSPPPATYAVARVTSEGKISMSSLRVHEILQQSSGMHARDLFSLALTSKHELGRKRSGGRPLRRPPYVILPRGGEVVVRTKASVMRS